MANTQDQESSLKEWAPLTDLFNKLPTKTNGLFSQEIKLTCINVLPEFLALGTNVGIVYWYDRRKKELQRLRCENTNIPVTIVKVVSTVEYMVACGNNTGNITIFQIPKEHPDSLPENLKPKQKQIERYTVTDLHKSPITAMTWSKNGMNLFSGDRSGSIVLTEIDFYMHMCKSLEILNESYEVVQLSYSQQRLLVSTTFRSIICQKLGQWKVCQVGKKDRKVLGKFGGLIHQCGFKLSDTVLYCTRPGLRMWISDIEGNVQKTLLFKDLLCKECPQVPLLNPISKALYQLRPQQEPSFGILLPFFEKLLVTYNNDVVYILDPQEMTILATVNHLRSILDVATYKDEIFILEEERSLIRIAFRPEPDYNCSPLTASNNAFSLSTNPFKDVSIKTQSTNTPVINTLLLQSSSRAGINIHTDENIILRAEEAKESLTSYSPSNDILKKFDDIGKQEFEDKIIFKKSKKSKIKSKHSESTISLSSNSSEEKDLSYTTPTIMNLSTVGVLPDLRSPESIFNDIQYKEKILADVLNLDKIKISLDTQENSSGESNQNDKNISEEWVEPRIIEKFKPPIQGITHTPDYRDEKSNSSNNKKEIIQCSPVISIPNDWNLSSVELEKNEIKERKSSANDSSLSDWEIV